MCGEIVQTYIIYYCKKLQDLIGQSVSEPHTCDFNATFSLYYCCYNNYYGL